jgi:hypothetical protein
MKLGTAIDTYLKSGVVTTTVKGKTTTVLPPPAAVAGVGTGSVRTTTLPVMQAAITAASASVLWAMYSTMVCAAIQAHILASTVVTTDVGAATGAGEGVPGCIALTGFPAFSAGMSSVFAVSPSYALIGMQIAPLLHALIATAIVTTGDKGPSWVGSGIGAIA